MILLALLLAGCSTLPEISPTELPAFVSKGPTVVMFTKPMCPPCNVQEAILADLAREFPNIRFGKVYAYNALIQPTDSWMVNIYNLKWTPTTVFQVDGKQVCRWITLHDKNQIWPILKAVDTGQLECTPEDCRVRR